MLKHLWFKMTKNNILDLHGVKHRDVEDKLIKFLFVERHNYCSIITGNSQRMKDIVLKFLDYHNYKYYIPSHNLGEIQVWE